jgi:hypothetical protein
MRSAHKVLIFLMVVPHKKHISEPPRSVTEMALIFYMRIMFVLHRKHIYTPPRSVTGITVRFTFLHVEVIWYDLYMCNSNSLLACLVQAGFQTDISAATMQRIW